MRIVLINKFWYPKGGSERYTFFLKDLLESRGHSVVPFAMADERNLPTPWAEYFVPHVDFWDAKDAVPDQTRVLQKLSRVLWSREAAVQFGDLLDEAKPDIVHLQNFAHQISPSILPECTKRGIPAIWTLHDYKAMCPNYRMYTHGIPQEKTFQHSQEYENVLRGEVRGGARAGEGSPCERCKGGRYWNAVRFNCMGSRGASVAVALEMTLHHAIFDVYGKNLAAVVAPSRFMAERLREWGWKGRVETIANFVEHSNASNLDSNASNVTPRNAVRFEAFEWDSKHSNVQQSVLFVGRLTEEKGIEDFLSAAEQLPEIPFVIIGDGSLATTVQYRAGRLPKCRFLGRQSAAQVAEHLRAAALVVVPSRWYENAPYTVLEAMAAGVPVIASRIGGLPELVRDVETGALVPPGDPVALAKAIAVWYGDAALRERAGARSRAIAASDYGPDRHYERIHALYAELAQRGGRHGS